MSGSAISVGPGFCVLLLALVAVAVVAVIGQLEVGRAVVTASGRAVLQLAAVSVVIAGVLRSPLATAAFIVLMLFVAVLTSARRISSIRYGWPVVVPIATGVLPVGGAILLAGTMPLTTVAILPIAGILIGGAMTATTLTGRRLLEGLNHDADAIETRLALGDRIREALAPTVRQAIKTGLVPAIDQTRNVGIVTLPGTFVGLVLGGASPAEAARIQLTVLLTLLAVELLSATVISELIVRTRIAPGERLREDVAYGD
jgi:putative ABC transport system permease protein